MQLHENPLEIRRKCVYIRKSVAENDEDRMEYWLKQELRK